MKRSITNNNFQAKSAPSISRSKFNRNHRWLGTFDADYLIPIFCDEVIPGDTHILREHSFGRLATPINPIMDALHLDTFYFFCPMRILWENYAKFFGAQEDPDDSIDYEIPKQNNSSTLETYGNLSDYFGIPYKNALSINALPFRAYWLCYDEFFRDQNLQDSVKISKTDTGVVGITDWNTPIKRGKRHDYFTSCLPWAQKGDTVQLPLGDQAPLTMDTATSALTLQAKDSGGTDRYLTASAASLQSGNASGGGAVDLYADLSAATGASFNEWRTSMSIQKFLETDARGGTRYPEKVLAHYGITTPDYRHHRPEYLGGGSTMFNISPVPQTSSTDATTPQGNLSAYGTVSNSRTSWTKSFNEHGYIIGIANVRGDISYSQGLDKMWSRQTQYDFYFPAFAHLGEQAVLNLEIYAQALAADAATFGFQERYAEYRYKNSIICGQFRPDHATSLDAWHLSEDFATLPTLGETFIKSNTPVDRVVAVPDEPHILLDIYFDYQSIRPMPVYGTPGMSSHF